MDKKQNDFDISLAFVMASLVMKIFTRYLEERQGKKLSVSYLSFLVKRGNGWTMSCPIRLITVATTVSLMSCAELESEGADITFKFNYEDLYDCVVLSIFVLVSKKLQAPILISPWLNFTLKNFLTKEGASMVKYFFSVQEQNLMYLFILYSCLSCALVMQVRWWLSIYNYYSDLWDSVLNKAFPLIDKEKPADNA